MSGVEKIFLLVFSLLVCQFAGFVGSLFTTPFIDTWYAELVKPSFNPPNWVFAPVWTVLFLLMGVSLYLVLRKVVMGKKAGVALWIFGIQLVVNALWSIIFFGLQEPFLAFLELIVLWGFIVLTIWQFAKISKVAAWLLVPYLLWVSFAGVLNYSIWILN